MEQLQTTCCIAGGGPAGMMLGYLLARAGVDVVVLEKHADFLRDFRGDTVHPSTLEIMYELGLLEEFLRRPHTEITAFVGQVNGVPVPIADLSHLPTRCKFLAMMPQWDFLDFLAEKARTFSAFHLHMEAEVTELLLDGARVTGLRARTPGGPLEVHAGLVIGADGRHSTVRTKAGLRVRDLGGSIDVLWMRLSRRPDDPESLLGYFDAGRLLVTLNRGEYWQCAYVIEKNGFAALQRRGLAALRDDIAAIAPFLRDRVAELQSWDDVKLLTVIVDRLERWWRAGLLCIGDAAHAMSPMGGVGINLAIQDSVAAANLLAAPLRAGTLRDSDLQAVQKRRMFPIRVIQAAQVFAAKQLFRVNGSATPPRARSGRIPWPLQLFRRIPYLRRIPARLIGIGVRPEHVHTPEIIVPTRAAS